MTIKEQTCPKCGGELEESGLSNCWPYEVWQCTHCETEYEVELVRDWSTLQET